MTGIIAAAALAAELTSCAFFHGLAEREKLTSWTQDAVWACENILARKDSGFAESETMQATETALAEYREAYLEEVAKLTSRVSGVPFATKLSKKQRDELAEQHGLQLIMEAVQDGF